jgi:hypothetical protein
MTMREQLTQEIEQAPDALIEEILDFCIFIKQRKLKEQSSPATPQTTGILDLLEQVKAIQAQVPAEAWEKLPHDGAINHDHYLYGSPKIEE